MRIQKKLEVSDEEFSKWKFSHEPWGRRKPLQDSDIVLSYFQKEYVYGVANEHRLYSFFHKREENTFVSLLKTEALVRFQKFVHFDLQPLTFSHKEASM
nr:ubiquitin carboxyl-terminal hydrolase 12 isoform X2 [Tanacetum cinerariifolium]